MSKWSQLFTFFSGVFHCCLQIHAHSFALSHADFEAPFAYPPYANFFSAGPYAGHLFRRNESAPSKFIAMPQCQTALMDPGEALINKVCSRLIHENSLEQSLVIAYRCFTRDVLLEEGVSFFQYPYVYVLIVEPVTAIKYEINGSAAFVYFRANTRKGDCEVVSMEGHYSGDAVYKSYSAARAAVNDQYCLNCREDLKPKRRIFTYSDVQYDGKPEEFKDDVNRTKFELTFNSILDPYLKLTSFVAIYYQEDANSDFVPFCSAYLLNKGIAFLNIFECKLPENTKNYVVVHRCFYGTTENEYYLKEDKIERIRKRDDGAEIYFHQHWFAKCRPTWEVTAASESTTVDIKLTNKGEL